MLKIVILEMCSNARTYPSVILSPRGRAPTVEPFGSGHVRIRAVGAAPMYTKAV